jgi:L-alanine-DL-glutamate epimerase-like enolase superfamily enzyme
VSVERVAARAYQVPTDQPEADGTLTWKHTTLVVASVDGDGERGIGWTYAGPGAVTVIDHALAPVVTGAEVDDVPATAEAMARAVRNLGRPGLVACAISALDTALWDLKARRLGVPLASLWGRARPDVPVYGSGGFTTYDDDTTRAQLRRYAHELGIPRVKIKIGEGWGGDEERDLHRVEVARRAVGPGTELYVDANGAYTAKQAARLGRVMAGDYGVSWFEEPVSSDDLAGLALVRDHYPGDVAAGEYGYTLGYFQRMIAAGAVDCIQADATRCGGFTSWLKVAAVAEAHHLQISGHCAPNLHAHVAVTCPNLRHLEYFHDHERIETMLFDGALPPDGGSLVPRPDVVGHGMTFKEADAEAYRVA